MNKQVKFFIVTPLVSTIVCFSCLTNAFGMDNANPFDGGCSIFDICDGGSGDGGSGDGGSGTNGGSPYPPDAPINEPRDGGIILTPRQPIDPGPRDPKPWLPGKGDLDAGWP